MDKVEQTYDGSWNYKQESWGGVKEMGGIQDNLQLQE